MQGPYRAKASSGCPGKTVQYTVRVPTTTEEGSSARMVGVASHALNAAEHFPYMLLC